MPARPRYSIVQARISAAVHPHIEDDSSHESTGPPLLPVSTVHMALLVQHTAHTFPRRSRVP